MTGWRRKRAAGDEINGRTDKPTAVDVKLGARRDRAHEVAPSNAHVAKRGVAARLLEAQPVFAGPLGREDGPSSPGVRRFKDGVLHDQRASCD